MAEVSFLREDDFFEPVNRRIFSAIREMIKRGEVADPFTLRPLFEKDEALSDFKGGCMAYFTILAHRGTNTIPIELYARSIMGLSQRRRTIALCESTKESAKQVTISESADEVIGTAIQTLNSFLGEMPGRGTFTKKQVIQSIIGTMQNPVLPISTGYNNLDDAMGGGLFPGKVYGFAARKKVGKTMWAAGISHHLNQSGARHMFICGEMSPEEIEQRNICRQTREYPATFRGKAPFNADFEDRLAEYYANAKNYTVYENAPGLTFERLQSIVLLGITNGIRGFVLDYLQLVGGKSDKKSTAEHQDEVAQWIADTARKHGLWAIVMAQINQEGNTRGGEGMRLAFDQVYQIHRPDIKSPEAWVEMMETRYTKWVNIGDERNAGYVVKDFGPYFEEV